MRKCFALLALLAFAVFAPAAADPVLVTVNGEVEFNQVSAPPLGAAGSGDPVTITFALDSDDFMDSGSFPVRGYAINEMSFTLEIGPSTLTLQDPFPAGLTPWFVVRDNDPGVDGFYLSDVTVDFPFGVPISQTGFFGQFKSVFEVTYPQDRLPSLDILDAVGSYDFTGLSSFFFGVTDGPFDAIGFIYESMVIEAIPVDDDGDGVVNADDLCPETMIAEGVPTHHLGVNRWALVDDDLVFDTVTPPGGGPGFAFDTADTGGCSCEQIIAARSLGNGHSKFGCSNGVMLEWADMVAGSGYVSDPAFIPGTGADDSVTAPATSGSMHVMSGPGGQATQTDLHGAQPNPGDRLSGAASVNAPDSSTVRSRTSRSGR